MMVVMRGGAELATSNKEVAGGRTRVTDSTSGCKPEVRRIAYCFFIQLFTLNFMSSSTNGCRPNVV